jgi:hypothetical protein
MNPIDVVDYGSILQAYPALQSLAIGKRRLEVSRWISRRLENRIISGPFKGVQMLEQSSWDPGARASMLLGLYEREVLEAIAARAAPRRLMIDIGAADGYYAVGVLAAKLFEHVVCYESSEQGRHLIETFARANQVFNRISIHGEATLSFANEVFEKAAALEMGLTALVLMDIEGGEFDLLSEENLNRFARSSLIIELHPFAVEDGQAKLVSLIATAKNTHHMNLITTGARDLSAFTVLTELSDVDRWLITAEGRPCQMQWLVLDPI